MFTLSLVSQESLQVKNWFVSNIYMQLIKIHEKKHNKYKNITLLHHSQSQEGRVHMEAADGEEISTASR